MVCNMVHNPDTVGCNSMPRQRAPLYLVTENTRQFSFRDTGMVSLLKHGVCFLGSSKTENFRMFLFRRNFQILYAAIEKKTPKTTKWVPLKTPEGVRKLLVLLLCNSSKGILVQLQRHLGFLPAASAFPFTRSYRCL